MFFVEDGRSAGGDALADQQDCRRPADGPVFWSAPALVQRSLECVEVEPWLAGTMFSSMPSRVAFLVT